MRRAEDGSVTLSPHEVEELFAAYDRLYDEVESNPASILDKLTCEEYTAILKWRFLLAGADPEEPSCTDPETDMPWKSAW